MSLSQEKEQALRAVAKVIKNVKVSALNLHKEQGQRQTGIFLQTVKEAISGDDI